MQSCHVHSNTYAPSLSLTCSCRTILPHFKFVPWGSEMFFFVGFSCLIIPFLAMIADAWTCACPVYCSTSPPTLIAIHNIHSRCLILPTYYARTRLQIACTCSDTTWRERSHTFAFRFRGSSHVLRRSARIGRRFQNIVSFCRSRRLREPCDEGRL